MRQMNLYEATLYVTPSGAGSPYSCPVRIVSEDILTAHKEVVPLTGYYQFEVTGIEFLSKVWVP